MRAGEGQATLQGEGEGGGGKGGRGRQARIPPPVEVVLPCPGQEEVEAYTGGYTVKRHGLLAQASGLPMGAVQLEFGKNFRRTPEARKAAAEAVALAAFYHLRPLAWLLERETER